MDKHYIYTLQHGTINHQSTHWIKYLHKGGDVDNEASNNHV